MTEKLILGPPGCGKTHTLINIVKEQLQDGVNPERIAFVSFSKKSVEEARLRASSVLDLPSDKVPWFRTLHSIGFKWLGMKAEEVITRYDFNKLGLQLGMVFDNNTASSMTDGLLPVSGREGNKYLELIGRAKLRKISLEDQYNDSGNYDISWPMLVKVNEIYAKYKSDNMKYDFTDMISLFVEQGTAPSLDVLIVDEAQDLTPLQWDQVDVLRQSVEKVWYAGDDDQAIYKWSGADVEHFINLPGGSEVLEQSYRVPRKVHEVAERICGRIKRRFPKRYLPRREEGKLERITDFEELELNHGTWLFLSQAQYFLNSIKGHCKSQGYFYESQSGHSLRLKIREALEGWKLLQQGKMITYDTAKTLYSYMSGNGGRVQRGFKKILGEEDDTFTFDELRDNNGLLATLNMSWQQALDKVPDVDVAYINALLRRGEDLTAPPRIKLSTIHGAKGGEAENVVLYTDLTAAAEQSMEKDPDSMHRVFYVAVTRTKQNLYLVEPENFYRSYAV